jgi:putative PIG3 family NAD(P)H quinone oxidoreductase
MWAICVREPGGPDVLSWEQVPDAVARPNEVLVRVHAAGVNRADLLQRQGKYPPPAGASEILGLECAGEIVETGAGVVGWRPGDRVCALLAGGGYAELVAVPAAQLLPVPVGLSMPAAAALPEAACTVWSTVFEAARLRAGETLLVHGGTSGIGSFAVQLAAARGVHVVATAGTPRKCLRAKEFGAELAVDYNRDDFVAAVRDHTGGRGADVILDIVGGAYLERNMAALAADGRLVVIATQGGRRAEIDLGALMAKRATVYAAGLRARPPAQKAAIVEGVREHVWPLVTAGAVRPVIEAEIPMADAARAHRIVEEGHHVGKVVLLATIEA